MMKRLFTIVVLLAVMLPFSYTVAAPRSESTPTVLVADGDVRLFPNPVESDLNVLCEKYDIERLMVFGASGEVVFNSPMVIPQGTRMTINMNLYPSGYYTVKVWVKKARQPLTYRIMKV